ncbi:MAG TPA: sulfite exporter TauE/SafE family protein [Ilumatobacter sp.]|nr:sulfite exporter TauE/SafE family protein [Ilumatobacter sp.]
MRSPVAVVVGGAAVGLLGGLIGLGGAEFRLPLLIGMFGFAALHAVIVNKATSLIVVLTALPVRALSVPVGDLVDNWHVAVNLLAGSLLGAWIGASWATRMRTALLYRVLAGLLVLMAVALFLSHRGELSALGVDGAWLFVLGIVAGFLIGVVASVMGVAGGELLIPTLVMLYGLDVKLAGSMSLVVSLPTMVVAFSRYSRDDSFVVLRDNRQFVVLLAAGSAVGAVTGGLLVGVVADGVLVPILAAILLISSFRVWRH